MKNFKKLLSMFLIISLLIGFSYSMGFTELEWNEEDPITDEWNMIDLVIARPIGIIAGIFGTGVFIISLPFTIPTKSVDKAANILIERPFKFSFVRKFPDEEM
jgi:uncharacterized membrane protein YfcA